MLYIWLGPYMQNSKLYLQEQILMVTLNSQKKQETLGILQQNLTCKVFPPDISLVIFLYIFSIVSLVFLEIFLVPKL